MPSDNQPTLGIFAGCCASAAGGTVSRLRMSVTMHPMALHHMGFSSRQPHADLLLSLDAVAGFAWNTHHAYYQPPGWPRTVYEGERAQSPHTLWKNPKGHRSLQAMCPLAGGTGAPVTFLG